MRRVTRVITLVFACGLLSTSRAFAECGPRPEKLCVLANQEGPIVIATVLGPADPSLGVTGEWRVHVDRSFRGTVKGDVVAYLTSGDMNSPARFLSVGDRLLLYLAPMLPNGDDGLSANIGCGYSIPLKSATKSELTFLARLGRRANDGHIFGEVSTVATETATSRPFGGVRVTATDGKRAWSAIAAANGTFDIGGLPPGSYRLSADVPGVRGASHTSRKPSESAQPVGTDDDPIILQPHGCSESDIEVAGTTPADTRRHTPSRVGFARTSQAGVPTRQ